MPIVLLLSFVRFIPAPIKGVEKNAQTGDESVSVTVASKENHVKGTTTGLCGNFLIDIQAKASFQFEYSGDQAVNIANNNNECGTELISIQEMPIFIRSY